MPAPYRLAEVATVFNGKTPSKAEQRETGFPVLKIKDVSETGEFRGAFSSFVDEPLAQKHSARWVKSGDTLILNAAHNADYVASKLFLADGKVEGSLPTGEWLLVRPKPECVIPEYLHYWLRSPATSKAVRFIVKGIHLYPKDVAELAIRVPTIAEQRRIVDILSRAEGIVRLRREAQKKAAEIIPALFLDMFGDPATNPKGWAILTVREALEIPIRNGISPSNSGTVPGTVLTLSAITRGRFHPTALKAALFAAPLSTSDEVCIKDFLVCRGNGNINLVGRGCFPLYDMPGIAFPDTVMAVRVDEELFDRAFFAAVWNTEFVRRQIKAVAKTTNGTFKINQVALGGIVLPAPPRHIQQYFANRIVGIEAVLQLHASAAATADATFDSLLGRSFQGCF